MPCCSPPTSAARPAACRLIAFSIRVVSAVIAFVSQVLLARWMGSFEYGIFVLVWVDDGHRRQPRPASASTPRSSASSPSTARRACWPSCAASWWPAGCSCSSPPRRSRGGGAAGDLAACPARSRATTSCPFMLGMVCLPMIALSDVLQGISRANSWALSALSPTYLVRPVLILVFMARRADRRLSAHAPRPPIIAGDRSPPTHHPGPARRRHRPHRPQHPGRPADRAFPRSGSRSRCRSSWSRASSSCSPMPTC